MMPLTPPAEEAQPDNLNPADNVHPLPSEEYHIPSCHAPRYTSPNGPFPIGIDTACFLVEDFTIGKNAELTVRGHTNTGTGEVVSDPLYRSGKSGHLVEGKVATYNHNRFQVRIYGPTALSLQTNLPKVLRADNVWPVHTPAELDRATAQLETLLRRSGIEADVAGSTITRLDICRNFQTEGALSEYHPLFGELTFPHTDRTFYGNGNVQWKNGERQLQLYDKSKETSLDTSCIQRLEYRLTSARSVRRHVGTGTVEELRADFSAAQSAFKEAVETLIPEPESPNSKDCETGGRHPDSNRRVVIQRAIESAFEQLNDQSRQTKDVVMSLALYQLRKSGSVEAFFETLREIKGRQAESRYRTKFKELGPAADIFSEQTRTVTAMAGELRRKLLCGDSSPDTASSSRRAKRSARPNVLPRVAEGKK